MTPWFIQHKYQSASIALLLGLILWLVFPFQKPFPDTYSRVVYDIHGRLLRVTLAPDGQIRFPLSADSLPAK
jgi:membrane carboxypeptidase/penicillin-binding protein PbpC